MLAAVGCASTRYDRTAGEHWDDKRVANRVEDALNDQPVYKYSDVKVQSFRGVVQLSGFVATEAQKNAATEIAQRVRGVGTVENAILIAPLDRSTVRDYIPGREDANEHTQTTNGVDRSSGTAPSGSGTSTGRVTR